MSDIKKAYQPLIALLEANKNKSIKTIMPQILDLVTAKTNQRTFKKDKNDNVTEIYCYYHKQWELITEHEYGKKASNKATGLNTMCKEGNKKWSKQQRDFKVTELALLKKFASKEINEDELMEMTSDAEECRNAINL